MLLQISEAPTMPNATKYQGAFFPALKKSKLLSFLEVNLEIKSNTPKYNEITINMCPELMYVNISKYIFKSHMYCKI